MFELGKELVLDTMHNGYIGMPKEFRRITIAEWLLVHPSWKAGRSASGSFPKQ